MNLNVCDKNEARWSKYYIEKIMSVLHKHFTYHLIVHIPQSKCGLCVGASINQDLTTI